MMDRLHDVFKLDGSGRCEEYSNWIVRERILVGSASCGYTSTHRAPGESVDVIAAHAPDLYDLKAIEHT